ncbi:MAG: FMN-binding negative transcriptional regulator [Sediminibacterium sp.]|jgi:transcriptional regulator|nr:FMN-binding negative transcriptional regulator [Sediminibacterium sp.]
MYHIPHFKAHSNSEVLGFMQAHPFVTIIAVNAANQPIVTHIPVCISFQKDGKVLLSGHVMRQQEHTRAMEMNNDVMVVFQGAHAYVSAQLYEPQNTASTWNYSAVHARAKVKWMDDAGLLQLLDRLTKQFEPKNSVSLVEHMDVAYVKQHMKAIVGLEMEVYDLQHVFKWSQNKDSATVSRITNALSKGNFIEQQLAAEMLLHHSKHD